MNTVTNGGLTEDPNPLTIGGRTFESRLIVGTGKYRDAEQTVAAIRAPAPKW